MTAAVNGREVSVFTIVQANVGRRALLGTTRNKAGEEVNVYSALVKHRVDGPFIQVNPLGLQGDEQVDTAVVKGKQVHGGRFKAIYATTLGTQARWRNELGEVVSPGVAFGENLTLAGPDFGDRFDEQCVYVGDEYACGDVILRVSGARRPCFKLGLHLGERVPRRMIQTGWTGWYFEVVQTGLLPTTGAILNLVNRRADMPTVAETFSTVIVCTIIIF